MKIKQILEGLTDEQVDQFHTELDDLVHKHLGHSSDEADEQTVEEETVKYEDHYDDRVVLTIEKDKLLYNGNPVQNYDWASSAKDIISDKFYARTKSWEEVHQYLVRFLDNPKGLQAAVRQVFNTNDEGVQVNEQDCWDGYAPGAQTGVKTKPGTGKNKGKRVNNCEPKKK